MAIKKQCIVTVFLFLFTFYKKTVTIHGVYFFIYGECMILEFEDGCSYEHDGGKWKITFGKNVSFSYKNWRGETKDYEVRPFNIWYGSTEFHKEEQFFLKAMDVTRNVERDFAINDILEVYPQIAKGQLQ